MRPGDSGWGDAHASCDEHDTRGGLVFSCRNMFSMMANRCVWTLGTNACQERTPRHWPQTTAASGTIDEPHAVSATSRPAKLPDVSYPAGSLVRKVSTIGDVRWRRFRILAGHGLIGQYVRIVDSERDIELFFGDKSIRKVPFDSWRRGTLL